MFRDLQFSLRSLLKRPGFTVIVVATHGLDADGLDTAVSVLGVEKGLALIESRPDAAALIVRRTPEGSRPVTSSRFREFLTR